MFYVFQFEDASWRISTFTNAKAYPVAGEARRLHNGIYATRADANAALARLADLVKTSPDQFSGLTVSPITPKSPLDTFAGRRDSGFSNCGDI